MVITTRYELWREIITVVEPDPLGEGRELITNGSFREKGGVWESRQFSSFDNGATWERRSDGNAEHQIRIVEEDCN